MIIDFSFSLSIVAGLNYTSIFYLFITFSWSSFCISSSRDLYIDFMKCSLSGLWRTCVMIVLLMNMISFFSFSSSSSNCFSSRLNWTCQAVVADVKSSPYNWVKISKSSSKHSPSNILKNFKYRPREIWSAGSAT